jgi:hypothetical protein
MVASGTPLLAARTPKACYRTPQAPYRTPKIVFDSPETTSGEPFIAPGAPYSANRAPIAMLGASIVPKFVTTAQVPHHFVTSSLRYFVTSSLRYFVTSSLLPPNHSTVAAASTPTLPALTWRDIRALVRLMLACIAAAPVLTLLLRVLFSNYDALPDLAMFAGLVMIVIYAIAGMRKSKLLRRPPTPWRLAAVQFLIPSILIAIAATAVVPNPLAAFLFVMRMSLPSVYIAIGISLIRTGLPHRVGSQPVCKFCNYEYTFGYPPETDLSAPPRCPECGKGWLADLAIGTKQTSPIKLAIGIALCLLFIASITSVLWSHRTYRFLPTAALVPLATQTPFKTTEAWTQLAPRLAQFTPQQHQDLFTRLLDLRLENPYAINTPQFAYLTQQAVNMPPDLRDRLYRESISVTARTLPSPRPDRTTIALTVRDRSGGRGEPRVRLTSVTTGDTALPITLEQAWPSLHDIHHYFDPSPRDEEPLIFSIPVSQHPLRVHLRLAIILVPLAAHTPADADPRDAAWLGDIAVDVTRPER